MMFYIFLVTFAIISLISTQPIDTSKTEPNIPPDEVVYVPYAIKYAPVEIPIQSSRTKQQDLESLVKIEEDLPIEGINVLPIKNVLRQSAEVNEEDSSETEAKSIKNKASSFDLFEEKFEVDPYKSSEEYVLLPVSVLRTLQEGAHVDSSSKVHIVDKRQAPPRVGLGPRRLFLRRPALVGYQNNYDLFPTVS